MALICVCGGRECCGCMECLDWDASVKRYDRDYDYEEGE